MSTAELRLVNYRRLMKKVEGYVADLDCRGQGDDTVLIAAQAIVHEFRDELGLIGGRVYRRSGGGYVLHATFGDTKPLPVGLRLPPDYPPIRRVLEDGTLVMKPDEPGVDADIEGRLGVSQFAAIEVDDGRSIVAFNVLPDSKVDQILFSLGILRHAVNQRLRRDRLEDIFREARRIQTSILPRSEPEYGDYDFAGRNESMESVGGDFFDYIAITDKILGVAIADVSGHGLPAALQVRDIYTGLRMGLGRDYKIVRTVERLNHIIHGSTLTSRFVSMFYGELELNGLFIYVNAGHPPPFHLSKDGEVTLLRAGGAVLGPLAQATYERGIVTMSPGDCLVLYTDGIVEASSADSDDDGEEYGLDRLISVAKTTQGQPADAVVDAIFDDVEIFTGQRPAGDDRTVVVVRYPEVGE